MKGAKCFVWLSLVALFAGVMLLAGCQSPGNRSGQAAPPEAGKTNANGVSVLRASSNAVQFAVLSDLHFNPFLCRNRAYTNLAVKPSEVSWPDTFAAYEAGADASLDHPGQDASFGLIQQALRNLTNRCATPAFVLCTGDYYAHDMQRDSALSADSECFAEYRTNEQVRENYVVNSEALVAQMLRQVGLTNVFPTLGNNDSVGDYIAPGTDFLRAFADGWSACTPPGLLGSEFEQLGCFAASAPGLTDCRILAFNTSLFSSIGAETEDSRRAIRWLADELATNHDPAILLFHIPPGLNYYSVGDSFWHPDLQRSFLALLATRHDEIIGSFCSHTHNDEFRLVYARDQPVQFIHLSPSISPVHGNSPAYQIFTATRSGEILNYATFYLAGFPGPRESWQPEYVFSSLTNAYNAATLAGLFFSDDSGKTRDAFHARYYAPGEVSSNYFPPGYWRTARLDAPVP